MAEKLGIQAPNLSVLYGLIRLYAGNNA